MWWSRASAVKHGGMIDLLRLVDAPATSLPYNDPAFPDRTLVLELIGHRPHGDPCFGQDARVGIIIDDGHQLGNPSDTQRRHDPELAEAAASS